jgi:hypothetical protein
MRKTMEPGIVVGPRTQIWHLKLADTKRTYKQHDHSYWIYSRTRL